MIAFSTPQAGPTPIRVFLVAEHAALRMNLALLLVGEGMGLSGSSGETATALCAMPATTDVVIVVLSDQRQEALDLVRELASRPGSPPGLVLSAADDDYSIREALAAGARGYVPSRRASAILPHAIREVAAGRIWVPAPSLAEI